MAQLITVRLNKAGPEPLGFRLQGGKDFGTPLVVQKVNGGSAAERAGLQAGDALIKVNSTDVFTLRHQEAQDAIRAAGGALELVVQRGGGTWRPTVTPTGSLPRPGSRPLGASPTPVTNTSLKANQQPSLAFGSGHNNVAKPFGYMNGDNVKSIVNKQYNTPVKMYSDQTIAETLSAQTEVLAGGVLGVNFKKNEKTYDSEKSAVFKVLQEEQNDPEPEVGSPAPVASGLRHVQAPAPRPDAPLNNTGGLPVGQNICEECERLITGVFVRIKDKNLHVECFKCSTCGTSLKNQGYYNLNGKLYCDIHAKLVARQNPPAPNLEPVTVPPGGRIPTNTYSTPLPPLATSNYSNGSSSLFSPNSNLSGPKPFGSSIGSAYSPSLSPRSAPLSPARPVAAPAPPAPAHAPYTPASAPAPAYAPAPAPAPAHAPFAPTKNVKSVVWPPPNPPEDEPPNVVCESNMKSVCQNPRADPAPVREAPTGKMMNTVSLPVSAKQDTSLIQSMSTSQQVSEFSSSASFAAASISTATASSQSETVSVVESKQSQQVISESSCTVQSITEQAVSQSQMSTMYQSQTSPPVEKIFDNPMSKFETTSMMRRESATAIKSEMVSEQRYQENKRESITESQIQTVDVPKAKVVTEERCKQKRVSLTENQIQTVEVPKTDTVTEERIQQKRESVTESQINTVDVPKTEVVIEQRSQENKRESVTESQIQTVEVATTEIITEQRTQETKRESLTSNQLNTVEVANITQELIVDNKQFESNMEQPTLPVQQSPTKDNTQDTTQNIPAPEKTFPGNPTKINVSEPNPISGIKPLPPTTIPNPVPKGFTYSMIDGLTTAPERPYSPLPAPTAPSNLLIQSYAPTENPNPPVLPEPQNVPQVPQQSQEPRKIELPAQPSPMFAQQPNRGITPIPPIKTYNPPEKKDEPIPMPPETKPYIPPDFKINIEPKVPRNETASPFVEALTTAPDRPFTPGGTGPVERGSLVEALTIAPERSYSPLPLNITNKSTHYTSTSTVQVQSTSSEIVRPIATQSTTQMTHSEVSNMQNTCKLQSSSEMSAFRPVPKQVFPPPQPEEFCQLTNFPPMSQELKNNFEKSIRKQEAMITESQMMQHSTNTFSNMTSQGYSSVKQAQSYFEQLDQRETKSSIAVRSKAGLHKPDNIPSYQKHFEQLPSQRGITPEICSAPAIPQRPVTPTTNPPIKPKDKSVEPKPPAPVPQQTARPAPQIRTPVQQPPVHFHKDAPITMTFQPVTDEHFLRASPARSRPSTPSMINKPAPIVPYYQMNLVTVEHSAPETHLYEPSSPEASRSPTPRMRSKSPAQGPPPNPLKAHAPRIKESTPQKHAGHSLLTQATSNLRKEHEIAQKGFQSGVEVFNASGAKNWGQDQPSVIKEQRHSNVGFKSETYNKGNMSIKEDSAINQNYGQRQMQSQSVSEYGSTTVQTSRKTFEEYETTQSAKVIEIHKGGSSSFGAQQQIESNVQMSSNRKQVFPPPVMSLSSSQQNSSVNITNQNVVAASRNTESCYPNPSISGANQGPVCDPTPSTGSSVGAAARGKAFGVSSAPKRGRANETPTHHVPHKPEFKSAAEERLIRKMAKMALNGYEIGVQRKIKPADHIQSMADKIQDTVVTKHPLNTDNLSSGDSSRENTLRRPLNKSFERNYKPENSIQNIGDKIKDTLLNNHPAITANSTNGNTPVAPALNIEDKGKDSSNQTTTVSFNTNGNPPPPPPMCFDKFDETPNRNFLTPNKINGAPVPPPIPNSPIPTFNPRTSPTGQLLDMIDSKALYGGTNVTDKSQSLDRTPTNKKLNGSIGSIGAEKEKIENNYLSTLRKNNVNDKSSFLNGLNKHDTPKSDLYADSKKNILGKRNSFEKENLVSDLNSYSDSIYQKDKIVNMVPDTNTLKKANMFEKISNEKSNNKFHNGETPKTDMLSHNLYDNTLYSLKPVKVNGIGDANNHRNWNISDDPDYVEEETDLNNDNNKQNDNDADVVVKRRQKKNERNADGRRDSHIIARPLSTMTSADVADGLLPVCHKCDKTITRGPFITALGRIWCPEHFICVNATCRRPLQDIGFVEENGQLYCEFCFEQYIAPACDKCHAKIKGDCLNAIGKHFHPECFNCVYCGKLFGNNPFFLEDGLPYCESDWNELFTTKCFACGFPVEAGDRWVEALNNNYHSHCFNCTVCKKNLEGQSFFAKGGRPFCKTHAR